MLLFLLLDAGAIAATVVAVCLGYHIGRSACPDQPPSPRPPRPSPPGGEG